MRTISITRAKIVEALDDVNKSWPVFIVFGVFVHAFSPIHFFQSLGIRPFLNPNIPIHILALYLSSTTTSTSKAQLLQKTLQKPQHQISLQPTMTAFFHQYLFILTRRVLDTHVFTCLSKLHQSSWLTYTGPPPPPLHTQPLMFYLPWFTSLPLMISAALITCCFDLDSRNQSPCRQHQQDPFKSREGWRLAARIGRLVWTSKRNPFWVQCK